MVKCTQQTALEKRWTAQACGWEGANVPCIQRKMRIGGEGCVVGCTEFDFQYVESIIHARTTSYSPRNM